MTKKFFDGLITVQETPYGDCDPKAVIVSVADLSKGHTIMNLRMSYEEWFKFVGRYPGVACNGEYVE